jgi:hypothetical protein
VPVLVINADPSFDLPATARRDGLDLFESDWLILADACDNHQEDLQRDRLWADWPPRLENNSSNLRAQIDEFLERAKEDLQHARDDRDVNYVVLFVVDDFAPDNTSNLISKDLLKKISDRIFAQDSHRDRASLTSYSYGNVWLAAYVRGIDAPEDVAERAWRANASADANAAAYVNTIFVSAFEGASSGRDASDFLAIRILAEMLLGKDVDRRFLQRSTQNAYQATCVIVPDTIPASSASNSIRTVLQRTITALLERGAAGAGSQVISQQAEELKKLADELVDKAKQNTVDTPSLDHTEPDRMIADLLAGVTGRTPFKPVWRGTDSFATLRTSLREHIAREQKSIEQMRTEWTQVRGKHLKDFAGINVGINRTIGDLSRRAVSSRGNDVTVLDDLITNVRAAIELLKQGAIKAREAMAAPLSQTPASSGTMSEDPDQALRALEFEFDHVPQLHSIGFILAASLAALLLPLFFKFMISFRNHRLDVLLAVLFAVIVVVITLFALFRRQAKLRQAGANLRKAMDSWRKAAFSAFDNAMRYQTHTLAIGWLDSVIDQLESIKLSIQKRGEALDACRDDLGSEANTGSGSSLALDVVIAENIRTLEAAPWDTWIMRSLRDMRRRDFGKTRVEAIFGDDGAMIPIDVRGMNETVQIEFRTPETVTRLAEKFAFGATIDGGPRQ